MDFSAVVPWLVMVVFMVIGGLLLHAFAPEIKGWFNKDGDPQDIDHIAGLAEGLGAEIAVEIVGEMEDRLGKYDGMKNLQNEVLELKEKLESLRIAKARVVEEYAIEKRQTDEAQARLTREMEHSLGLHRLQVEAELKEADEKAQWKVEEAEGRARLEVEKGNLDTEKAAFEERMTFMEQRLTGEVESMRGLVSEMLERLPKVKTKLSGEV